MTFLQHIFDKVIDLTATLLVVSGLVVTPMTSVTPEPEQPYIPPKVIIDASAASEAEKTVSTTTAGAATISYLRSLTRGQCPSSVGTSSPISFTMPSPIAIDTYNTWNFFRTDTDSGHYLSFFYPPIWKVKSTGDGISISRNKDVTTFELFPADFSKDDLDSWLRDCFHASGPLAIGSRRMTENLDFEAVSSGTTTYLFRNRDTGEFYTLSGLNDSPMWITRFPDEKSFSNQEVLDLMASYAFRRTDDIPTLAGHFLYGSTVPSEGKESASPDGKYIAFTGSNEGGEIATLIKSADGAAKTAAYWGSIQSWSPDSKKALIWVPIEAGIPAPMTFFLGTPDTPLETSWMIRQAQPPITIASLPNPVVDPDWKTYTEPNGAVFGTDDWNDFSINSWHGGIGFTFRYPPSWEQSEYLKFEEGGRFAAYVGPPGTVKLSEGQHCEIGSELSRKGKTSGDGDGGSARLLSEEVISYKGKTMYWQHTLWRKTIEEKYCVEDGDISFVMTFIEGGLSDNAAEQQLFREIMSTVHITRMK